MEMVYQFLAKLSNTVIYLIWKSNINTELKTSKKTNTKLKASENRQNGFTALFLTSYKLVKISH